MTYDQLKDLPLQELLALIQRAVNKSCAIAAIPGVMRPGENELPEPVLCCIGDFEIRARFHNSPNPNPIHHPEAGVTFQFAKDWEDRTSIKDL